MVEKFSPALDPRETLQRLCVERGEDFASLSRLVGRNAAYIQQFVRRGTPRRLPERERRLLARHFDVSEQSLGGEASAAPADRLVAVPSIADERGSEGAPQMAFDPDFLRQLARTSAGDLRLMRVEGDSMAPTLLPGDEILIDAADGASMVRDGLYALLSDDRRLVRRLALHPIRPECTVQADNPAHPDWPGIEIGSLVIIGRLVWAGRRIL